MCCDTSDGRRFRLHRSVETQNDVLSDTESGAHAKGQRKTLAGNVAGLQPKRDGDSKPPKDPDEPDREASDPQRLCWPQSSISPKIIPLTPSNFPASFKLHQACDRFGRVFPHDLLERESNRECGSRMVSRARRRAMTGSLRTRCLPHCPPPAVVPHHGQMCAGMVLSGEDCRQPGVHVNTVGPGKIAGDHGRVKGDQSGVIAQVGKQSCHVAAARKDLRVSSDEIQIKVRQ